MNCEQYLKIKYSPKLLLCLNLTCYHNKEPKGHQVKFLAGFLRKSQCENCALVVSLETVGFVFHLELIS